MLKQVRNGGNQSHLLMARVPPAAGVIKSHLTLYRCQLLQRTAEMRAGGDCRRQGRSRRLAGVVSCASEILVIWLGETCLVGVGAKDKFSCRPCRSSVLCYIGDGCRLDRYHARCGNAAHAGLTTRGLAVCRKHSGMRCLWLSKNTEMSNRAGRMISDWNL